MASAPHRRMLVASVLLPLVASVHLPPQLNLLLVVLELLLLLLVRPHGLFGEAET